MRKKTINKKTKTNKKIYFSWFLLGLFVLLTVFFMIQTATSGAQYAEIERQKNSLISENKLLKSEAMQLSSLKGLEDNAEGLGYVKPSQIIYISDGQDVAKAE